MTIQTKQAKQDLRHEKQLNAKIERNHMSFENLVEQLDHCVDKWNGKTTITESDICILMNYNAYCRTLEKALRRSQTRRIQLKRLLESHGVETA